MTSGLQAARLIMLGDDAVLAPLTPTLEGCLPGGVLAVAPDDVLDDDVVLVGVPAGGDPELATLVAELSSRSSAGIVAVLEAGCTADDWDRALHVAPLVVSAAASPEELRAAVGFAVAARRRHDLAHLREEKLELTRRSIEQISMIDTRTGLYNRRFLMVSLEDAVAAARRYGRPLSLCVFEVRNHAELEARHGATGLTGVYEQVADTFSQTLRGADIEAWVGRDRFAVMLPETNEEGARRVAERIREQLGLWSEQSGVTLELVSGVATVSEQTRDAGDLMSQAESLLTR